MNATILKYTVIIYAVVFGLGIALPLVFRKTNWGRNMFVATASWLVLFILFIGTSFAQSSATCASLGVCMIQNALMCGMLGHIKREMASVLRSSMPLGPGRCDKSLPSGINESGMTQLKWAFRDRSDSS